MKFRLLVRGETQSSLAVLINTLSSSVSNCQFVETGVQILTSMSDSFSKMILGTVQSYNNQKVLSMWDNSYFQYHLIIPQNEAELLTET